MNRTRHLKLLLLLMLSMLLPGRADAVTREENIDRTIRNLHTELVRTQKNLDRELSSIRKARANYWQHLERTYNDIDKAMIEMYSQDGGSLFALGLSSDAVSDVCENFRNEKTPFEKWLLSMQGAANRHRKIKESLQNMHRTNLNKESLAYLEKSIILCDSLDGRFAALRDSIALDRARYDMLSRRIAAMERSNDTIVELLRSEIFERDEEDLASYFNAFDYRSGDMYYTTFDSELQNELHPEYADMAEWGEVSFLLGLFLSIGLWIVLRIFAPKDSTLRRKKLYYSLLLFLGITLISNFLMPGFIDCRGYLSTANDIWVSFYLFVFLLLLQAILRLNRPGLGWSVVAYLPLIFSTWWVTDFVTMLTRTTSIKLMVPILFTFNSLMMLVIWLFGYRKFVKSDYITIYSCMALMLLCTVLSYVGYCYLAIFIIIYCMSVTAFLAGLACFKFIFGKKIAKATPILNLTLTRLVYPYYYILTVVGSLFSVANCFNLHTWLVKFLSTPFIDVPQFGIISISRIIALVMLGIAVSYLIRLIKTILYRIDKQRFETGGIAVAITIGSLIVWTLYILTALYVLQINHAGIIAVLGGAGLGLGFALKDTLENLFCGLQLMASRARPGDIVECNGARGVMKEIGIMSSEIEIEDGPMVLFPNRLIYANRFTNLTLNNRREIRHIIFDISDQSDLEKARALMMEAARDIDGVVDPEKHYVVMKHTSSGIVRLDYKCWIDSAKYLRTEPAVREAIFKAFKANNIQIADFSEELGMQASGVILNPEP